MVVDSPESDPVDGEDPIETAMWDEAAGAEILDDPDNSDGTSDGTSDGQSVHQSDGDPSTDEGVGVALEPSGDADIIANARRRYGSGGALLAAGMLGLDHIIREKVKPDSVQVQEAPTDPVDLDAEGIRVTIDESLSVNAPALGRVPLVDTSKKRRR